MDPNMSTFLNRAIFQIREMILRGELAPGERITEEGLAERLAMSRTPIRAALPALAREGLLTPSETRGYFIRAFSQQDAFDAIELRGMLEGMAARLIAEHGATAALMAELRSCLATGDKLLLESRSAEECADGFAEMNARFHRVIVEASQSRIIADALAANDRVPFATANAIAFDAISAEMMLGLFRYAQQQHHVIVRAIGSGEGSRAETLMREHARLVKDNLSFSQQGGRVLVIATKSGRVGAI
jgi:GntR family transcriptional regulator, vanillate catabolism transcriptional regulator